MRTYGVAIAALCLLFGVGCCFALSRISASQPPAPALRADLSTAALQLPTGDDPGDTPLHAAAYAGQADVAASLLGRGADPNAGAVPPLFLAVLCPDPHGSVEVARLLLKHRADPNATLPGGQTPLLLAASLGRTAVAELLLDAGAFVNARGSGRRTALHEAAAAGRTDTVALLLARGADTDARDAAGRAPLHDATEVETAVLLMEHGASPNPVSDDGSTPLMKAAARGDIDLVERLLCAGAEEHLSDGKGWTALHYAAKAGAADCAELILIAGAEPNLRSQHGNTPLSIATDPDTAKVIRSRGGRR